MLSLNTLTIATSPLSSPYVSRCAFAIAYRQDLDSIVKRIVAFWSTISDKLPYEGMIASLTCFLILRCDCWLRCVARSRVRDWDESVWWAHREWPVWLQRWLGNSHWYGIRLLFVCLKLRSSPIWSSCVERPARASVVQATRSRHDFFPDWNSKGEESIEAPNSKL